MVTHSVVGCVDVCGAAGVFGAMEGSGAVEVSVTVEKPMVIVARILQREPEAATVLRFPWLLCTLQLPLLPLSLFLVQHSQSFVQEVHLCKQVAGMRGEWWRYIYLHNLKEKCGTTSRTTDPMASVPV